jgi:hypothetical protein
MIEQMDPKLEAAWTALDQQVKVNAELMQELSALREARREQEALETFAAGCITRGSELLRENSELRALVRRMLALRNDPACVVCGDVLLPEPEMRCESHQSDDPVDLCEGVDTWGQAQAEAERLGCGLEKARAAIGSPPVQCEHPSTIVGRCPDCGEEVGRVR